MALYRRPSYPTRVLRNPLPDPDCGLSSTEAESRIAHLTLARAAYAESPADGWRAESDKRTDLRSLDARIARLRLVHDPRFAEQFASEFDFASMARTQA